MCGCKLPGVLTMGDKATRAAIKGRAKLLTSFTSFCFKTTGFWLSPCFSFPFQRDILILNSPQQACKSWAKTKGRDIDKYLYQEGVTSMAATRHHRWNPHLGVWLWIGGNRVNGEGGGDRRRGWDGCWIINLLENFIMQCYSMEYKWDFDI